MHAREQLARSGAARLRVAGPPHWWEGWLTLTSERLFFVADVEGNEATRAAFWLADVAAVERAGGSRIRVRAGDDAATFDLTGAAIVAGRRVRAWLRDIERGRRNAVPRSLLGGARRATG